MQGKVEICGVNTSKLAVLDSATTRRLLLRVRQGDKSAREELIAGNLRLVLSVIQRFSSRGENIDDLFQVGCIGLIKAIDNFDAEAHDVRFSTYGVPMIAGEIRRYLRDNSALRVSRAACVIPRTKFCRRAKSSPPRPAASRPRRRFQPLSAFPGRRSLSRSTRSATP